MRHLNHNQHGIAHLGLILIATIILGILGFTGWTVYKQNQSSEVTQPKAQTKPAENATDTPKEEPTTLPANFVYYENTDVGFKFAYPKEWGTIVRSGDDREDLRTDGLNGRPLRSSFQSEEKDMLIKAFYLSGDQSASTDEGLYHGGYIKKDGGYYFGQKYIDGLAQLPQENIISEVTSPMGTILVVKSQSICGEYVQLLANLPSGNPLHGLNIDISTDPQSCPETIDIDASNLQTLEAVAKSFEAI